MSVDREFIRILSDGRFHSAADLTARLSISRNQLGQQLRALAPLELRVQAVPGRGYRLAEPLELLDRNAILSRLDDRSRRLLSDLEIFLTLDSTSDHLGDRARERAPSGYACFAEHQRRGRGRRGRHWISPFAANLYLSLLWRFASPLHALGGLSLAAGIAVVRALEEIGVLSIGLKWPNDVLWHGRKLAGILVDLSGEPSGPCYAVVGVGVNVQMPPSMGAAIDQPWTDLHSFHREPVSRNRLAGLLLHHLLLVLQGFREQGLVPFLEEWNRLDAVAGKEVALNWAGGSVIGIAQGVSPSGELVILHEGTRRAYAGGEVSLRLPA